MDNLRLADQRARRGKSDQCGVQLHAQQSETNIFLLHEMLLNKTYKTSKYTTFKVYEPKERLVFRLPFYPDRIAHHAIMNVLEPIFVARFTKDTYSCIKGRGIHAAARAVRKALYDVPGTTYCLKFDIRKFYPSIDHEVLKNLLRRKIKDQSLLWLLDEIIDSADGVPIGNYTSQYFANYYLTYFDYWVKQDLRVKHYFRYADDIVVLADNKPYLHKLLAQMRRYLDEELHLQIKGNYQVFPVQSRGIDFVGYRLFHTHILLRKRIKKNFARMLARNPNRASIASYRGWAKHANAKHLLKKLLPNDTDKFQGPEHQAKPKPHGRRQDQHRPRSQPRADRPLLHRQTLKV